MKFDFSVWESRKDLSYLKRLTGMNVDGEGSEEGVRTEEKLVFMWGYLPGALPQRTPILSPTVVPLPQGGASWKDVCGGGCGFAMAIEGNFELGFCFFLLTFSSEFVVGESAWILQNILLRILSPFV